jgi:hypothetical protein
MSAEYDFPPSYVLTNIATSTLLLFNSEVHKYITTSVTYLPEGCGRWKSYLKDEWSRELVRMKSLEGIRQTWRREWPALRAGKWSPEAHPLPRRYHRHRRPLFRPPRAWRRSNGGRAPGIALRDYVLHDHVDVVIVLAGRGVGQKHPASASHHPPRHRSFASPPSPPQPPPTSGP